MSERNPYTDPLSDRYYDSADSASGNTRIITPGNERKHKRIVAGAIVGVSLILGAGVGLALYSLRGEPQKATTAEPQDTSTLAASGNVVPEREQRVEIPAREGEETTQELGRKESGSPWRSGHNRLKGYFSSGATKVDITVELDYSPQTGRLTNPMLITPTQSEALDVAVLSSDGTVLSLKGNPGDGVGRTRITVQSAPGSPSYMGEMSRDDTEGTALLKLQ